MTILLSILGVGVMLFSGIGFLVIGIREHRQRVLIAREGIPATGTIIERRVLSREPGFVFYTFDYKDRTYTGKQRVSYEHMNRINIGEQVSLRFLPSNPSIALLSGEREDNPWTCMPIFFGCLFLGLLLALPVWILLAFRS
ncbi:hypothetical protein KSF_008260 [Reticulibacter mediterranei]|uniref:DUF3592 domain-containing protein n=1 Tax=Reticulibacter mediterranei TaxID=2778369 RepID=A0A8J3IDX7_9CHLR|nr:DUF3592 domain-containing protein [Reticulibacter mediterranei]GHO90778.1 hypothetical protein KSF_008260 [Reticulibacter mediterranei]